MVVNLSEFEKKALEKHNEHRAKHGVPPLEYSRNLAADAQKWADEMAHKCQLEHAPSCIYGENICSSTGCEIPGDRATDLWYEEVKDYSFEKSEFHPKTGHFTQVVWLNSTHLGIAISKDKSGRNFYVCARYDPPGNFEGKFKTNVFPTETKLKNRNTDEKVHLNLPTDGEYQKNIIHWHNIVRVSHEVGELTLSKELCNLAQKFAESQVKLKANQTVEAPDVSSYGRNQSIATNGLPDSKAIFKSWYLAGSSYDFSKNTFSNETGAFSQIVWKGSQTIGIGLANYDKYYSVVALYDPPGNIKNYFSSNVFPKKKEFSEML